MKTIYITMLILAAAVTLSAQTGLFGLSFGDNLNKADSLMSKNSFVAQQVDSSNTKIVYTSEYNHLVDSVVLFVNPDTEILVGWYVKYKKENSNKQDDYLIQRLHEMHGAEVKYDEPTGQLIWGLTHSRSVHAQYVLPDNLCVEYYDAAYANLFKLPSPHWRSVVRDPE